MRDLQINSGRKFIFGRCILLWGAYFSPRNGSAEPFTDNAKYVFQRRNFYENTVTAVPYAMVKDKLKFDIWLNARNYMKFTQANGKNYIFGYRTSPVMVIQNEGNRSDHSKQTNAGSSSIRPRMVAGLERMKPVLTNHTNPLEIGKPGTTGVNKFMIRQALITPNPANDKVFISWPTDSFV